MNKYKMTGSVLLAAILVSACWRDVPASGNTTGMEGGGREYVSEYGK